MTMPLLVAMQRFSGGQGEIMRGAQGRRRDKGVVPNNVE
jgi:hypothetical protein